MLPAEFKNILAEQQSKLRNLERQTKAQQNIILTLQQKLQSWSIPKPTLAVRTQNRFEVFATSTMEDEEKRIDSEEKVIDVQTAEHNKVTKKNGAHTANISNGAVPKHARTTASHPSALSATSAQTTSTPDINESASQQQQQQQPHQSVETALTKAAKPPPINVYGSRPDQSIELSKSKITAAGKFSSKRITPDKHVILTENLAIYKQALEALKNDDKKLFSYTPKEEKLKTYLLKNLEGSFHQEEILQELKALEIPSIEFVSVAPFSTKHSIANNKKLPMFIVQLSPLSKVGNLSQVKRLPYQEVTWEKFRKTNRTQCRRGQREGHSAANCLLTPRCVKCAEEHPLGECPVNNSSLTPDDPRWVKPKCVHCKGKGHPA